DEDVQPEIDHRGEPMIRTLLAVAAFLLPIGAAAQQTIAVGADGPRQVIINGAPASIGQLPPPPPPPVGGGPPTLPGMPPRDSGARPGPARIRGRVAAADTGAPIRKAQIRAMSPETRDNRLATTDAQGYYEFKELPAGRYTLMANKGSYVSLQYGQ